MTKVHFSVADGVAVLEIDNPPVNATSHAVRNELYAGLRAALDDAGVAVIVVLCRGNTFIAGADITEFGKPPAHPALSWLIDQIEASSKPVVAAIHGTALGGGLELAMGCHYRIAHDAAKLGQPEVKLGLLPGGGGTQRLPRIVGIRRALEMIVQGEPITARDALECRLVDRVTSGDLRVASLAYAAELRDAGATPKRVRDRADMLGGLPPGFFVEYRQQLRSRVGRAIAPMYCVDAVEAATTLDFDEGRAKERALFQELVAGRQSQALRHVFFATREASKTGRRLLRAWDDAVKAALGAGACAQALHAALDDFGPRARSGLGAPSGASAVVFDGDRDALLEPLIAAVAREGQALLDAREALRASDIDVACIELLGWPAYLGGPMFHAENEFTGIVECVMAQARSRDTAPALTAAGAVVTWAALGMRVDRLAAGLRRRGVASGDKVALLAALDAESVIAFLAILRAGACVVSLSAYATAEQLARMLADSGSRAILCSDAYRHLVESPGTELPVGRWLLDGTAPAWESAPSLEGDASMLAHVRIQPQDDFNLVYSSGTTSEPNGIVQSHAMRMGHVARARSFGYGEKSVTVLSTPLSSNITTVGLFATLAHGGHAVLMPRFWATEFIELCGKYRATHTTMVPVQYERVLADPLFDRTDLSSFCAKLCVGSPLRQAVKREIVARWPGNFYELYSSTEGGVTCVLDANAHPDKLHTVGKPAAGNDVRMIGEDDKEVAPGEPGEIVGHSETMMQGYYGRPDKTAEISWFDAQGRLFYRTGDIGRFDEDGFLQLLDRKKDMILSGGLNIYPADIEAVVASHPNVEETSVVGVDDERWGEVPVAFVRLREVSAQVAGDAEKIREWANERLGKAQRVARVSVIEALPRSAVGKVLKRELREQARRETAAER